MNILLQKIKNNNLVWFILISMISIIFIDTGLDVTDTGYILNSYKYIYTNPESTNFSIVFTSMIGNVLLNILEFFNIPTYLGMKLFGAIFSVLCTVIVYKVLKDYFNEKLVLIGLVIATILSRLHIRTLMYNNLTAFFFVIICALIIKGLNENRRIYIFLSGVVLGFNVFVRISNVALICILLSIVYLGFMTKDYKKMFSNIFIFVTGFIISLVLSITIIYGTFGISTFLQMISVYFGEAVISTDGHSILDSIKINLNQGLNGLFFIGIFYILTLIGNYILSKTKITEKYQKYMFGLAAILPILFVIGKVINIDDLFILDKIYLMFYSKYQPLSIAVSFYVLITIYFCFININNMTIQQRVILLSSLFIMISMPMGSNQGFQLLYQSLYFQIPIIVVVIYKLMSKQSKEYISNIKIMKKICITFLSSYFIVMMIINSFTYVYRDQLNKDKYSLKDSNLKLVSTNKARSQAINELLEEVNKYTVPGKKVITYGSIPLISYLLDMPPFFDGFNGWLEMSQLNIESMNESLLGSQITKEYPLIIVSNVDTNNNIWPYENTIGSLDESRKSDEKYKLIIDYANENGYKKIEVNECFDIYVK